MMIDFPDYPYDPLVQITAGQLERLKQAEALAAKRLELLRRLQDSGMLHETLCPSEEDCEDCKLILELARELENYPPYP